MEIFTLEISLPYSAEEERWVRVIEVRADFTIRQLHNYIQDIVNFDDDHLYEFYVGKNSRKKSWEVSDETMLSEIYPITGYKLYYLFDFGDSWLFQIKKSSKRGVANNELHYPRLISSTGSNPAQYPDYEE